MSTSDFVVGDALGDSESVAVSGSESLEQPATPKEIAANKEITTLGADSTPSHYLAVYVVAKLTYGSRPSPEVK